MSNLHSLIQISTELLKPKSSVQSLISESMDLALAKVHDEILALALRLLASIILTAAIIYSFISISEQINFILLTQENGGLISIGVFLLLLVVCLGLLVFLLKRPSAKPEAEVAVTPARDELALAIEKLLLVFIEGLIEGLEASKKTAPQEGSMAKATMTASPPVKLTAVETGEMP